MPRKNTMSSLEKAVFVGPIVVICAILCLVIVSFFGGLMPDYSDGDRSGIVVKISKKGVIWKSWEGEMLLGGMTRDQDGTMVPTTWKFSLPASAVDLANEISAASNSGKRVTISYSEYLIGPITLSSGYVAKKITVQP